MFHKYICICDDNHYDYFTFSSYLMRPHGHHEAVGDMRPHGHNEAVGDMRPHGHYEAVGEKTQHLTLFENCCQRKLFMALYIIGMFTALVSTCVTLCVHTLLHLLPALAATCPGCSLPSLYAHFKVKLAVRQPWSWLQYPVNNSTLTNLIFTISYKY